MKLNDLIFISEASSGDLMRVERQLQKDFRPIGLSPVMTTHFNVERVGDGGVRSHIDHGIIYKMMWRFLQQYNQKIIKERESKRELTGIITDQSTDTNIVFSIDYDRPARVDPHSGKRINFLKLITAMVSNDFKSDQYPNSRRYIVRT